MLSLYSQCQRGMTALVAQDVLKVQVGPWDPEALLAQSVLVILAVPAHHENPGINVLLISS